MKIEDISTKVLIKELYSRLENKTSELKALEQLKETLPNFERVFNLSKDKIVSLKKNGPGSFEEPKSLNSYIKDILKENPAGLKIKAIIYELEQRGWSTTSNDIYNVVAVALAGGKKWFKKIDKGTYRLIKEGERQ